MKKKLFTAALLVAVALGVGGCYVAPINNITNAPVEINTTQAQVEKAILQAGKNIGWRMNKVSNGLIEATLRRRAHIAQIEIKYNDKTYSITYKDSYNLNYDGENIHGHYNGWVENLNRRINYYLHLNSMMDSPEDLGANETITNP
jgi:hypothetical protein